VNIITWAIAKGGLVKRLLLLRRKLLLRGELLLLSELLLLRGKLLLLSELLWLLLLWGELLWRRLAVELLRRGLPLAWGWPRGPAPAEKRIPDVGKESSLGVDEAKCHSQNKDAEFTLCHCDLLKKSRVYMYENCVA
jgi:hypothetical protein